MAHWFGTQDYKTKIFVRNVDISAPVTVMCFPLCIYAWVRTESVKALGMHFSRGAKKKDVPIPNS